MMSPGWSSLLLFVVSLTASAATSSTMPGGGDSNTVARKTTEESFSKESAGWVYMNEFKAIMGGVLGFWGGVGSMGTLFLVVLMTQRYCCRNNQKSDSG